MLKKSSTVISTLATTMAKIIGKNYWKSLNIYCSAIRTYS